MVMQIEETDLGPCTPAHDMLIVKVRACKSNLFDLLNNGTRNYEKIYEELARYIHYQKAADLIGGYMNDPETVKEYD